MNMAEVGNVEQTADQEQPDISTEKTESLDKWLLALKEDLASWISRLLKIEVTVDTFTSELDTGVVPCKLANIIQSTGEQFFINKPRYVQEGFFPPCGVTYKHRGALHGSFIARDNVCNFIRWCRELGVPDVIMFETEDLVSNKNEKAVLLTLLEVARKVFQFGVDPPELVRLENEIDKELQDEPEPQPPVKVEQMTVLRKKHKSHSLDDLVFDGQDKCTCPTRYPVHRITDGKYRMGESKNLIFVRVMRKHVMVRVGGGWDTLERYFEKHDPCRVVAAQRKNSRASRPPITINPPSQEPFVRSPSSMSMCSISSTDSYDSTSTAYSHMSVCSTPPQTKHGSSPRGRTSGGTSSPTYDRCKSPKRGSHSRHKSPCSSRGTPPRTTEAQGRLSNKCKSLQDLQRQGSETGGFTNAPKPKARLSSARRSSAAVTDVGHPKSTPATQGSQRRKSIAVTPRRDSAGQNQTAKQKKEILNRTVPQVRTTPTPTSINSRSRSMQDLHRFTKTNPKVDVPSPNKQRPTSARTRPSSATTSERSRSQGPRNVAPSPRRSSTSQATRKHSSSISNDSPRRRPPVTGSPINSPRTSRRSSSTPRGSGYSPVSSPRVSRKNSSTSKEVPKSNMPTLANNPGGMRRAISNLSSPTPARIQRSASFSSKEDCVGITRQQLLEKYRGSNEGPKQSPAGTKKPSKPSKVPMKIPGKQPQVKKYPDYSPSKPRAKGRDPSKAVAQNGYPKGRNEPDQIPVQPDLPTPFDNYSYTSEDTSSVSSDKDSIPLAARDCELSLEFSEFRLPQKGSNSSDSTPDTVRTIDLTASEMLSTTASECDYLECESMSSSFSFGPSPTKELLESHDMPPTEEADGSGGILARLKSLNVQLSSIKPTLRGKISTPNDDIDGLQQSTKPPNTFSLVDYSQKEPEERSKFFDIENVVSDDKQDIRQEDGPRKFSLVHALIGSIEKRNEPAKRTFSDKNKGNIAALSTKPRPGGEAVTGSSDSAHDSGMVLMESPMKIEEHSNENSEIENKMADQFDENDNLRLIMEENGDENETPTKNGIVNQYEEECNDEQKQLKQFEEDEKSTTGIPIPCLDGNSRTQQGYSLDDMIDDMLPGNKPGKEGGDHVSKPRFEALI